MVSREAQHTILAAVSPRSVVLTGPVAGSVTAAVEDWHSSDGGASIARCTPAELARLLDAGEVDLLVHGGGETLEHDLLRAGLTTAGAPVICVSLDEQTIPAIRRFVLANLGEWSFIGYGGIATLLVSRHAAASTLLASTTERPAEPPLMTPDELDRALAVIAQELKDRPLQVGHDPRPPQSTPDEGQVRRLEEELRALRRDHATLLRRQREASELIARGLQSTAWRLGHRATRATRAASFRPAKSANSAFDLALRRLEEPLPALPGMADDRSASTLDQLRSLVAPTDEQLWTIRSLERLLALTAEVPKLPGGLVDLSHPLAVDIRGVVSEAGSGGSPTVEIVVCVHNALDDVRRCLASVVSETDRPFGLVLVDDGSDAATSDYLRWWSALHPTAQLIRRDAPPHGYTLAANAGMRATSADVVVLLNSDTIVTPGWLDRILDAFAELPEVGIAGPLSNAATLQSVPSLREDGRWARNPLGPHLTPALAAALVAAESDRRLPRFPFINGFCFAIRREVLNAVGEFDELLFASGYGEENDFSQRAREAGFDLAIVDDAYVYHAESRSYGDDGKALVAKKNYETFRAKHGPEVIDALVREQESDERLTPLRERLRAAFTDPSTAARAVAGRTEDVVVRLVLDGVSVGGSGGTHVLVQEVAALRDLGVDARLALPQSAIATARAAYPGVDVWESFADPGELAAMAERSTAMLATHFLSVPMVLDAVRGKDTTTGYYVQDYEPLFVASHRTDLLEMAHSTYEAMADSVVVVKTAWLGNVLALAHDLAPVNVGPSVDTRLFNAEAATRDNSLPVHVVAMVRPSTPRRRPHATAEALAAMLERLGTAVRVSTFGCDASEAAQVLGSHPELLANHRGTLDRAAVADLLRTADVFVDLSTYQAFGLTGLEAMACGATCVLPNIGGCADYAVDGVNARIVDTLSETAPVDAVVGLVTDRPLLARLQAAALQTGSRFPAARSALSLLEAVVTHRHRIAA